MKRTISAMSGPGVIAHNRRNYIAENVDRNRTSLNIEYCYTDIRQMYHQLFDSALAEFNAKQKRKDRMIENYYEKICSGKQEKPFYEVIFQIGNKDDMSAAGENGELAKTVLDEFMRGFQQRNPHLQVFSAHLHMDEATPHLHIDFIPFTTGSKRGLSTRVSLKQALADQGFAGEGKSNNERNRWVEAEKRKLHQDSICIHFGSCFAVAYGASDPQRIIRVIIHVYTSDYGIALRSTSGIFHYLLSKLGCMGFEFSAAL